MHQFFPGVFFNFETIRILGMAPSGGAELGEVLDAVGKIKDSNSESWHTAWHEQAKKAETLAYEAEARGDRLAAKNAFLRASNYARASYYMMTGTAPLSQDPRMLPICDKAVSLFRKATTLFDDNGAIPLRIPYEGIPLPGYLYLPPSWRRLPGRKTPILLANSGADGLSEEIYFFAPATALEQGYAAITYEGPGQGVTLHHQKLTFRPDWEVVVGAVLDHLETLSGTNPEWDLDLKRIAIWGTSLGGYFALRGAAGDHRIRACVALDPVYDFYDFATTQVPKSFLSAWGAGWIGDGVVDAVIRLGMRLDFQMKWNIFLSASIFGITQPSHILKAMKAYTLKLPDGDSRLRYIRCPVLVTGAKNSLYLPVSEHTQVVYDGLASLESNRKEIWIADSPGEGGLQAKVGAVALANQRVFGFLDSHFGIARNVGAIKK